jgi:hypothetical protein
MHDRQFIATEADVARDFEDFIRPIRSASPFMWARSQNTRPGPNSGPIFVDYQLTWPGTGDPRLERAVIIGDFKKPGTLKPEEWADLDGNVSEGTKILERELRGSVINLLAYWFGSLTKTDTATIIVANRFLLRRSNSCHSKLQSQK